MSQHLSHPASLDPSQLLKDCAQRRTRGSGPGGQHRNKVETAIELTHNPTGVTGAASERRSLADNRRNALFRLRVHLALDVRGEYAAGQPASALWRSRCKGGRIALNPKHDDFPAMLAEALDVIVALRCDVAGAATVLACSSSQLVKLLKEEPRALERVNLAREAAGLKRFR
ncbi:MAG: peptide chain release factor-like protein [Phycisphaeraceae bacterium]